MTAETSTVLVRLEKAADAVGLRLRGGFNVAADDGVPPLRDGRSAQSLVLLGSIGGSLWPSFSASPEARDGASDPLDRWSRRTIDALANETGATAFYPFGGPPYLPFQRWAMKAEPVAPSPLGILIHPEYGLWHGYRGALGFAERFELAPSDARPTPCESCTGRPCLSACPVQAFTGSGFLVDRCRDHLETAAGTICVEQGCLARAACPVGRAYFYPGDQIRFHMAAFRRPPRRAAVAQPAGN